MKEIFISHSPEETMALGKSIAEKAAPGDIIALTGDLGTGKTVFTKGIARGLGIDEPVSSPTFTIVSEYRSGRMPLFHFDVYRIGDPEEMDEVGLDDYLSNGGLSLIEWAELISDMLPPETVWVTIEKDLESGFDFRRITIERPEKNKL
jgi:tRNA threonylcarbamoyladenosine biosynthesis protein TsaE